MDPQFPAADKSLYHNPEDAKTWQCGSCQRRNPLPPLVPRPTTMPEAEAMQARLEAIRCANCAAKPMHVVQVNFVSRPAGWLRPTGAASDPITDMLYPTLYRPEDAALKSRLCVRYVKDDMGNTLGRPWAVVREEARPEDVVQGAIGRVGFRGSRVEFLVGACCITIIRQSSSS